MWEFDEWEKKLLYPYEITKIIIGFDNINGC